MIMHTNQNLYNNLLARRSIRRYKPGMMGDEGLLQLEKYSDSVHSLDAENIFEIKIYKYQPETLSGRALGGFGRIMEPPYYLAPYITGNHNSLIDLGFCTQQIVLDLWRKGIGSCYVGCAHRQRRVRQLLGLSEHTKILSFVIFGQPDTDQSLRLYQKVSQFFTKSKKRFSYEELFLDNLYPKSILRNSAVKKIIEAGRMAPSATNAQPWRFEIKDGKFIIYAHQKKVANLYDLEQGYSLHDTGICMANMSMAAQSLEIEFHWNWINSNTKKQSVNEINIPVAYFMLDELRSK